MQPRPSFDLGLLIAIAVGVVALLGLAGLFLTDYGSESPIPSTVEATMIPSDAGPLETEIVPSPPSATPTHEETPPTATGTTPVSYPGPPVETPPSASTLLPGSQPAPSASAAPDQVEPLPAGKHDDTHPGITYDRFWVFRRNSGTKFAYKGSLHISGAIGNEASFHFTGRRLYFGYQRGRSFGTVTVMIDDQTFSFHEQAFGNIWRSPQLEPGTHAVRIIHENGESVNLDYIEVVP